jgi:hypothetical protein
VPIKIEFVPELKLKPICLSWGLNYLDRFDSKTCSFSFDPRVFEKRAAPQYTAPASRQFASRPKVADPNLGKYKLDPNFKAQAQQVKAPAKINVNYGAPTNTTAYDKYFVAQ